jgi:hypothetical protein
MEKGQAPRRTVYFAAPSCDDKEAADESTASTQESRSDSKGKPMERKDHDDVQWDADSTAAVAVSRESPVEKKDEPSEETGLGVYVDSAAEPEGSPESPAVAVTRESLAEGGETAGREMQ